ncbi:hypothetical protein OG389_33120 [Streptomyces sp. NBC_00435]|uniref:hypothetical protein n=1 Tax=Streptomyces sp. NBC_00435 TaxID=2903649 RepID=UPI002E1B67C5
MLKPTRTILALAAGSLVLGLVGAGSALADGNPRHDNPGQENVVDDEQGSDDLARPDESHKRKHVRGVVTSRGALTVRSRPTTHSYKLGKLHPHEKVAIECKKRGERVDGNNVWYLLDGKEEKDGMDGMAPKAAKGIKTAAAAKDRKDHWVSARYIKSFGEVKYCR